MPSPRANGSHLAGVVEELGLMRVELVGVLRRIQADVFAPDHLMYVYEGGGCNKQSEIP